MKTKAKCRECGWSQVFESEKSNHEAKQYLQNHHSGHYGLTVRDVGQ